MPQAPVEFASDPFVNTPYRSVERLDQGGMGEVYVVEHRQLHRSFVAKILRPDLMQHPQVVDRMRLEAQALGRLNHPNIVSVAGFGTSADGRPFLVLEHLRGRSLRAEIQARGALPLGECLLYALELLAGLSAAHALGIVHRDIRPDNLFLATEPSGVRRLKILDFGIARVMPDAPAMAPRPLSLKTATGALVGTPHFSSPEAVLGGRVDARADLYSAALVLYAMLTGRGPFDDVEDHEKIMQAQALAAPPAPSRYAKAPLPPAVDALVLRALAKDPGARFQSAEAFTAELYRVAALARIPQPLPHTTSHGVAVGHVLPPSRSYPPAPAPSPVGAAEAEAALEPRRSKPTSGWALAFWFLVATGVCAALAVLAFVFVLGHR